jgi:hypothetical protein
MNWGAEDFLATGLILGATLGAIWLALQQSKRMAYLMAFAVGLGAVFLLVWVSLAVGIIGEPGEPANLVFAGVLAVAAVGTARSKLSPGGLSWAMGVAAGAQLAASAIAVAVTAMTPGAAGLWVVTVFNLGLAAAFGFSAWLFRIDDGMRRAETAFDAASRPY